MISQEDKERVVQATDFVSLVGETVVLHERGAGDFWGRCPFHEERTESFHVNTARGLFYCFGCEAKGDVIDYVQRRENLDFLDALHYLADRAGIELHESRSGNAGPKRNRLLACLELAERHFSANLLKRRDPGGACDRARRYLGGRSLGLEVSRRWGLGFALGGTDLVNRLLNAGYSRAEIAAVDLGGERGPRLRDRFYNRVMFPIRDETGRTIGFGGRVLDDAKPKYLNSRDSRLFHKTRNLYALDRAKAAITASGRVLVVEGYTDAITLHEAGFTNAVAILGTALTSDHLRLLNRFKPKEIVSLLDGDAAGQRAAEKALAHLGETEARLTSVVLPEGKDPAEYLEAYGAASLAERLGGARDLVLFVLDRKREEARGASPGGRRRILGDACAVLAPLKANALALSEYAPILADMFDVPHDEVLRLIREAPLPSAEPSRPPEVVEAADGAGAAGAPAPDGPEGAAPVGEGGPGQPNREPLPDLEGLTANQRKRILLERQLLALLVSAPGALAAERERIAALSWEDPRHGAIARVLLEAPVELDGAGRLARARAVDAYAPQLLSASAFDLIGDAPGPLEAAFMVDSVELEALRAESRALSASLSMAELEGDAEAVAERLRRSQELRRALNVLEFRVRNWNRP